MHGFGRQKAGWWSRQGTTWALSPMHVEISQKLLHL